jgi:hypothetical protein
MRAILAKAVAFILDSRHGIGLAVISATLLFGLFEFAVSRWLIEIHISPTLHCAVQAALVASGAGIALWLILLGIIDRRRMLDDELHRVAELNHTLRNALEVIVLAHYIGTDQEHKAMVLECTSRIDQKMRELFPAGERARIRTKSGKRAIGTGRP